MKHRGKPSILAKSSREWLAFIRSLTLHRVRFIVVGAHALAALGRPRLTGDLDIFVEPTRTNAERLRAALLDFGFPTTDAIYKMAEPGKMIRLGVEPLRIDVSNELTGLSFEEAWQGRVRHRLDGRIVYYMGRREYIKNKRATAESRPDRAAKDLSDIALLEEIDE